MHKRAKKLLEDFHATAKDKTIVIGPPSEETRVFPIATLHGDRILGKVIPFEDENDWEEILMDFMTAVGPAMVHLAETPLAFFEVCQATWPAAARTDPGIAYAIAKYGGAPASGIH
jgi:hypothetical protein